MLYEMHSVSPRVMGIDGDYGLDSVYLFDTEAEARAEIERQIGWTIKSWKKSTWWAGPIQFQPEWEELEGLIFYFLGHPDLDTLWYYQILPVESFDPTKFMDSVGLVGGGVRYLHKF